MQGKANLQPVIFGSILVGLVLAYLYLPIEIGSSSTGVLISETGLRKRSAARNLLSRSQQTSTYAFFKDHDWNPTAAVIRTPCYHAATDAYIEKALDELDQVVLRPNVFHPDQSHPKVMASLQQTIKSMSAASVAKFEHHAAFELVDEIDEPLLTSALEYVQMALVEHVNCPRLHILAGAILIRLGRDGPATTLLEGAVTLYPAHPELLLLTGMLYEFIDRPEEARNSYLHAVQANPRYSKEFFGVPINLAHNAEVNPLLILRNLARGDATQQAQNMIHVWALRRLVLAWLVAEDYSAGPYMKREEARQWQKQWYFHVHPMISPYASYVARSAYRQLVASGTLKFNDGQAIRFTSYNDPTARFLLATHTRVISRITDMPMKPTYSYLGAYLGNEKSELAPHTDRPQCEFTSSTSMDVSPVSAECPLGLNPVALGQDNLNLEGDGKNAGPEDKQVYVYPKNGDSLLFKGRHLVHWRKPIAPNVNCTNLFMHYVHESFAGGLN